MSDDLTVGIEATVNLEVSYTEEEVEEAIEILGGDGVDVIVTHSEVDFRETLANHLHQDELESISVEAYEVDDE